MSELTTDDLLRLLGRKEVQIESMRMQMQAMANHVCPTCPLVHLVEEEDEPQGS